MDWISENIVSLLAFFAALYSVYISRDANKRSKERDEIESKISLNLDCKYNFYNQNVVKVGGINQIGKGLRFSLRIDNFGFRHAFIKEIFLMKSDNSSIQSVFTFNLNTATNRTIKSADFQILELWIARKDLKIIFNSVDPRNIFIRITTDDDSFFDSNTERISVS